MPFYGKELATVKRDLLKAQAKLKNKDAKIRELKGQIAKLNKMVFDTQKDHHPNDTYSASEQGNGSSEEPQNGSKSGEGRTNSGKQKTSHSKPKGRKKREFPPHLERKKSTWARRTSFVPAAVAERSLDMIPTDVSKLYRHSTMLPKECTRSTDAGQKTKLLEHPTLQMSFPTHG